MVRLSFSVWGEDIIERELLRFSERNLNAAPAFAAIAEDMRDNIREQFDTEGQHRSGGWAPLKPETILAKEAAGYATAILHRTLDLRDSLIDMAGKDHIEIITPESLEFGSGIDYGVYHQSTQPRSLLPRRPPIDFNELDKAGFMKTLQRYLVTGDLTGALV
jgi:phage gpG-like protein